MNNIGTNLVGMVSLRGREDNDYYATPPESTLALLSVTYIVAEWIKIFLK